MVVGADQTEYVVVVVVVEVVEADRWWAGMHVLGRQTFCLGVWTSNPNGDAHLCTQATRRKP